MSSLVLTAFDRRLVNWFWAISTDPRAVATPCSEHGRCRSRTRMVMLMLIACRFPNTDMIADPLTKHFCENGDTFNGWIGQDVHFLFPQSRTEVIVAGF